MSKNIRFLILILLYIIIGITVTNAYTSPYNDLCGVEEDEDSGDGDLIQANSNEYLNIAKVSKQKEGIYFLEGIENEPISSDIYNENINFSFKNIGGEVIGNSNISTNDISYKFNKDGYIYVKNYQDDKFYKGQINESNKILDFQVFNNSINFEYIFNEDGYIFYKNNQDNGNIYKIKESCTDLDAKGKKILDSSNKKYIFEENGYIYFRDYNDNKLYKAKKDSSDLNNPGILVSNYKIYISHYGTHSYSYLFNDETYLYVRSESGINRINYIDNDPSGKTLILNTFSSIYDNPEIATESDMILLEDTSGYTFILNDENYIYYEYWENTNELGDDGDYIYSQEVYKIKKDGTNNQLILKDQDNNNYLEFGFDFDSILSDNEYIYTSYGYYEMKLYKFKKDGSSIDTGLIKVIDSGYIENYYINNGELYYFDYSNPDKLFKYKLDGTNDIFIKDDSKYKSDSINISSGTTDVQINIDSNLGNNTKYDFYLANLKTKITLFNENEEGVYFDRESLFLEKLEYENGTLEEILAKIKVGDYLVFEKEGEKVYLPVLEKDYEEIYFGQATENSSLDMDIEGSEVYLLKGDYTKIDNSKLDGNSKINIVDLFGENTGELFYKIELNSEDNTSTPVINNVTITDGTESDIINLPTNLKQYIKSPLLEREELGIGKKVGKFQSGSGIIFTANLGNQDNELIIEVYKSGSLIYSKAGTGEVQISYDELGSGSFYWKAKEQDNLGNISDLADYGNNISGETDFSFYSGFEPYPHGYKFINNNPDYSLLDGSILANNGVRTKGNGTKWEIMDIVFPLSYFNYNEKKYIDVFEYLGLNNDKPAIFNGNCFGLAFSAVSQYINPSYMKREFRVFSELVGDGEVFNKINITTTENKSNWIGLEDVVKNILAAQLFQYDTNFAKNIAISEEKGPTSILNEIKNNPSKEYILNFKGKINCNIFGYSCDSVGHAVVPYRVEGNKIYIWDNNIPYPFKSNKDGNLYAYDRYIEINLEDNTFISDGYDWDTFDKIGIVSSNQLHKNNLLLPGFNQTDIVYTISGDSDMILSDSEGRKTGFLNGEIYEEIPGVNIITILNGEVSQNNWKQIYLPEKIENLQLEILGNREESYDLMIAGGDYYAKLENVETSTGQIDVFNINRNNIQIDLDDEKIGEYNLVVDDFQNNSTGSIYIDSIEIIEQPQQFTIDWLEVSTNSDNSVVYETDTDNDGEYDVNISLSPISTGEDLQGESEPENKYTFPSYTIPYNSGQQTAISGYYTIVGNHEGFTRSEDIQFTTGGKGNPTVQATNGTRLGIGSFRGGLNILMDVPPRGETYTGYVYIQGLRLEFTTSKDPLPLLEVGTLDFGTRTVNYSGTAYSNRVSFPFLPENAQFTLTGEGNPTVQISNGTRNNSGTVKYGTNIQAEIPAVGETRIIEFTILGQTGRFTIIRE